MSITAVPVLPLNALPDLDLLDLVDFKWLMAAEGRRINLTRLQADTGYADACFVSALQSECEALRRCARRLHESVNGVPAVEDAG